MWARVGPCGPIISRTVHGVHMEEMPTELLCGIVDSLAAGGTPTLPLYENTWYRAFLMIFPHTRMPTGCTVAVDSACVHMQVTVRSVY